MAKRPRKTPRHGDVVEFDTANGRVYMQFTHDDRHHGPLLRVLPGYFTKRPEDFGPLVRGPELYFVFVPIGYAVRKGFAAIAAYEQEIPERVRPFPLMRWAGLKDREGRAYFWVLWDGVERGQVERLSEEQRALSIVELAPYPTLIERLENGWLPRTDTSYKL